MKYIFICFLLFGIIAFSPITAQNLTIDETIKYINEKINENKISEDENAEFLWQVSDDGKLTITKYNQNVWNLLQSVYLKSLDTNTVFLNNNNQSTDYYFTLEVACKNKENNVTKTYSRDQQISAICIRFKPDKEVADRLKNALIYLIRKAYGQANFKG